MAKKLCTGPSHAEPTWLEVNENNFNFYRSGPKTGEPVARCKRCINWKKLLNTDGPHGLVEHPEIRALIEELILRCDGIYAVERIHGIVATTLRGQLDGEHSKMQKRTAKRILEALAQQRQHDRKNGTSKAFREALQAKAQREGRQNYLLAQDARWALEAQAE